jgi:Ca2+-binding EF-hand superfamily protein
MSGEPSLKNLDLDGDGVVEEEELQQVFDEADINDDGYIDEEEAKVANLDSETAKKLNQFNQTVDRIKQNYRFKYS